MIGKKKIQAEYDELKERYLKVLSEKAELEYEISMYKENAKYLKQQDSEILGLHQSMRQLKHDMKNHLMIIASYINDEDYGKAKSYTSNIIGKLNAMHSYIETGNTLMNHIVNEKLEKARSNGIAIKAEIENLKFGKLESMDFSSLLSNMLDNAIEASMREVDTNRELHVMISKQRAYETICVKNRIGKSILKENPELKTTKAEADNHGLGIRKIKVIVETCEGMCDIYEEENFFCVKVFIPE